MLLGATLAALVWVNVDASSYASLWGTELSDPRRQPRHLAGSARLGELRADDVLLLRRRARGAPRVRHGGAARAAAVRDTALRRPRRDDRAGRDLPRVQRRQLVGARLGDGDVDGHGVRARAAGARRLALPEPAARVPADRLGRRRRPRARRDRGLLQRERRRAGAPDRDRDPRRDPRRAGGAHPLRPQLLRARVLRARRGDVGRAVRVRRRPGRGRPHRRSADVRVSRRARRPRAGERPLPDLPRAADAGAGARGAARARGGDLAERAAAAALPPVDELRDRAAVRPRQRGDRHQRRLPRARVHVADHARDPLRLPPRQAQRHRRRRRCSSRS